MKKYRFHFLGLIALLAACQFIKTERVPTEEATFTQGTFGFDMDFLNRYDSVILLKEGDARVIVSAKYQGKVFTSSAEGVGGVSFGWINYDAFDRETDPHMNAFGGENRLWLGPEGNKFSLFFRPGEAMIFENWVTPAAIDTEAWTVKKVNDTMVSLYHDVELMNYQGFKFQARLERDVAILDRADATTRLGLTPHPNVRYVAYATRNKITNTGDVAWTKDTGAPCLWILDMFKPSASTVIVVPFKQDEQGTLITTDYFGLIPKERLTVQNGLVLFAADGRSRGKIGIRPHAAKPFAGSFDAENNILTVVVFDVKPDATYLNQEWNLAKNPFEGDAVNAYNDGPLEDGSQMGPFYELESVSPAALLSPGQQLLHEHAVFHFMGERRHLVDVMMFLFGDGNLIADLAGRVPAE